MITQLWWSKGQNLKAMARYSKAVSLGDAIKEFLEQYKHSGKLKEAEAVAAWPRVMGPNIQAFTQRVYMKNGKLFVQLKSATMRAELMMHRGKIISALNQFLGSNVVKEVVLR